MTQFLRTLSVEIQLGVKNLISIVMVKDGKKCLKCGGRGYRRLTKFESKIICSKCKGWRLTYDPAKTW